MLAGVVVELVILLVLDPETLELPSLMSGSILLVTVLLLLMRFLR